MEGKVIKCRAAVIWNIGEHMVVEDVEVEPPHAGEVRVKIYASGVCHSDLTATKGVFPEKNFPCIMGHEGAGIVESIGEGVTSVKPGDKVIPLYMFQCFDCAYCETGKSNSCSKIRQTQNLGLMPDGTSRFTCKGKTVHHFMGTSTFSEYTVVPEIAIAKISDKAPLEKVCLIGCGIPTGYGAALNTAKVEPNSVCAVWGLGCIGLSAVMGCKKAGASRIFAIDINPDKFDKAMKLGATDCLNPNDFEKPIQQVVKDMTNGIGVDYAIECVGAVVTMLSAIEAACNGWGVAVLMGVPFTKDRVPLDSWHLILGKTIKGSGFGGYKGRTEVSSLVEDYLEGKLEIDEFITHNLTLDEINKAFELMIQGESIRSIIHF